MRILGVMPCAGTASRLAGLPKYLLPVDGRNSCLWARSLEFLQTHTSQVVAAVSERNRIILEATGQAASVPLLGVGETATMSETVARVLTQMDAFDAYWLVMPDTYWHLSESHIEAFRTLLYTCDVVVAVWPLRPEQYGQLGQCRVEEGRVIDIQDKKPGCTYPYAWGTMAWRHEALPLLDPTTPHTGYMIKAALKQGRAVGAVVAEGHYWDCGTFPEYFSLVRHQFSNLAST